MSHEIQFVVATEPTTELELAVEEFLLAKRQVGRSPATIAKYKEVLDPVVMWLAQQQVYAPADLDNDAGRRLLRRWGAGLYDNGIALATVRHRTATVRSLLGWLFEERLIENDLRSVLKLPTVKPEPQRTLSYDEVLKLLATCDDSPLGVRNRALINFLVDTGLRASELCRTKISDLQFDVKFSTPQGEVVTNLVNVRGKGGHRDVAWFGQETARCLRAWLPLRQSAGPCLFVSIKGITPGHPLTVAGLRTILLKLGRVAGVSQVSTHAFRRSMACLAEEAGASTREVMEYGRWGSLELVERYTQAYQAGRRFAQFSPADYVSRAKNQD